MGSARLFTIALYATLLCSFFINSLASRNVHYSKRFDSKNKELARRYSGLYDDWWQTAVFYQIYPRSFKDSDGDGNGDIQGIIQKLEYFSETGIDAVWLSPIYTSPQVDNGYDISDYRDVDSMYGSLSDLKQLLDEAHKRDIKVILDYVPNHTSDQHEWFKASVKGTAPYDEYYIWQNATYVDGERKPPNNWLSSFKGSAWEWNEERQQYYYHQFAPAQPDLNYRNPEVVKEMTDVRKYWLDFGVDGFRMDAVSALFEDELLRDEPPSEAEGLAPDDPATLDHIYTSNLNETLDMIYEWRDFLDDYSAQNGSYSRIMMTEVYADISTTMRYYISDDRSRLGAHFTFNFRSFILETHIGFDSFELVDAIKDFLFPLPIDCTANWVLGNHDKTRVATRLGVENIDALNIVASLLPAILVTYQGEEIGAENGEVTCEQGYDPQAIKNCTTFNETSRDFERTPYQWDSTKNAGFSDGNTTWLPVSHKYNETNLELESDPNATFSHYHIYKRILEIRKDFKNTTWEVTSWGGSISNVFYLTHETEHAFYGVVFNIDDTEQTIYDDNFLRNTTSEVVLTGSNSQYSIGDVFDVVRPLKSKETVVLKITRP